MHNDDTSKLLVATSLLLCLLIFSLQPTALSLDGAVHVVSSSGSVAYDHLEAALIVTDSTPEGPVPYEIDGHSNYETGLTYTVSAGMHTIELPSPYTSPISNITYNFSYWQSGSTDNPRTVTLHPSVATSLHGIYSTSEDGDPPTPPPPPPPSGNLLAYTGVENNIPPPYEDGWAGGNWVSWSGGDSASVSFARAIKGSSSLRMSNPTAGDNWRFALTTARASSGLFNLDFYQSYWIYIAEEYAGHGWWQFWEMREFDSASVCGVRDGHVSIYLMGHASNMYWWFVKSHQPGGYTQPVSFSWYVKSTTAYRNTYDPNNYPDSYVTANPHEVPWNRWFKLEIYLHRGRFNDGIFTVWITDPQNNDVSKRDTRILFHIENRPTSCTAGTSYKNCEPAILKHYGWSGVVYYDEIYLYNYNAHASS